MMLGCGRRFILTAERENGVDPLHRPTLLCIGKAGVSLKISAISK
jgi:hypothetical protein